MRRRLLFTLIVTALAGCNPYVNIPPDEGDVAAHKVNRPRVREAMMVGIRDVVLANPPDGPYIVDLPNGADDRTYAFVVGHLPGDARPATKSEGSLPTYRIETVRLRGHGGRVGVRRPGPPGRSLVTVSLQKDIEGWYALDRRVWRSPVADRDQEAGGSGTQAAGGAGGDGSGSAGATRGQ